LFKLVTVVRTVNTVRLVRIRLSLPAGMIVSVRGAERPAERAERELRQMIAGMPAGAQLPVVRQLAADLGTSPETVRKALSKLAGEGLVTIVARWGVFVSE
jgi:DNA-binding GntR family transcriptional regulator